MNYKILIDHVFGKKRKPGKITFKRTLVPQVILYHWEEEFAYKAPFKILSGNYTREEEICSKIEGRHPEFVKRKEFYLFADSMKIVKAEDLIIRPLIYKDEEALSKMKELCSKEELDIANISIYDHNVTGAFYKNKLVGVACCDTFGGVADVAVLVHPQYRRKKVASTLITNLAQNAIKKDGLCLYRVDDFNIASYEAARKLGFEKKIEVTFYELEEKK